MKTLKYITLAIFLFSSASLIAAGPQGKSELLFSEGLICYQNQSYQCAEKKFLKALTFDCQNPGALHYLGLIAFQNEEYTKASDYFAKAIEASPDSKMNPESRKNLKLAREKLEQQEQAPLSRKFGFGVTAGTYYDSNASLNPDDLALASLPTDKDDAQFFTRGDVWYRLISEGRYRLKVKAGYAQSFYPDLSQFDYGVARGEVLQEIKGTKASLSLPLSYEFSLLNDHKYLESLSLKPNFRYRILPQWMLEVCERLRYDDFFQTLSNVNQNRDAVNLQSELGQYITLGRSDRYLHIFYFLENNFAKGNDWDYLAHAVGFRFVTPIVKKISAEVGMIQMFDRKFKNVDSVLGEKRDDRYQNYHASLTAVLGNGFSMTAQYQFMRNASNTALFQYNRHLTGVSLAYTFE